MISVNVTDTLTPHYRQVMGTLASTRPLAARLGKTLEVALKRHFERLQSRPNKRGWPKKNFWTQVKRSTGLTNVQEREATAPSPIRVSPCNCTAALSARSAHGCSPSR